MSCCKNSFNKSNHDSRFNLINNNKKFNMINLFCWGSRFTASIYTIFIFFVKLNLAWGALRSSKKYMFSLFEIFLLDGANIDVLLVVESPDTVEKAPPAVVWEGEPVRSELEILSSLWGPKVKSSLSLESISTREDGAF